MAITDGQRAWRAGRIGASDAARVMAGDWRALWREKTGRAAPADLGLVAAVQIGIATEHLHPRFVEAATGVPCVPSAHTWTHPDHDWLVAHPDFLTWAEPAGAEPAGAEPAGPGRTPPPDVLVEAKFSAGFLSDDELAERHHWQVQHQFLVTGFARGLLSVLRPAGHTVLRTRRHAGDGDRLMETLAVFWWHVANDVEPADHAPVDPPRAEAARVVDMGRHNRFAALAAALVERRRAALAVKADEAALKALMPPDARIAFAAGLHLARDREGRLSLRYGEPPRRALDRAEPWTAAASPDLSLDAALAGCGEGRDEPNETKDVFPWAG